MRVIWDGTVLAGCDVTVVVDGNRSFRTDSIDREHVTTIPTHATCPYKGDASYKTIVVDGAGNPGLPGSTPSHLTQPLRSAPAGHSGAG